MGAHLCGECNHEPCICIPDPDSQRVVRAACTRLEQAWANTRQQLVEELLKDHCRRTKEGEVTAKCTDYKKLEERIIHLELELKEATLSNLLHSNRTYDENATVAFQNRRHLAERIARILEFSPQEAAEIIDLSCDSNTMTDTSKGMQDGSKYLQAFVRKQHCSILEAEAKIHKLQTTLRKHHERCTTEGSVVFIESAITETDHGPVIDLSDAYSESSLYEETIAALNL